MTSINLHSAKVEALRQFPSIHPVPYRVASRELLIRSTLVSFSKSRLLLGDYVVDLHERNDCTYYAITKTGSNDIVSMGHELTFSEAEASARWTISQLDPNATAD
jgi:hypothetical protein